MRKPWMDGLKAYRFARTGLMTRDTTRAGRDFEREVSSAGNEFAYARALGVPVEEARARIAAQKDVSQAT